MNDTNPTHTRFLSRKVLLVIILGILAIVNGILLYILFLTPPITITNSSRFYTLKYQPTQAFSEFLNKNNAALAKSHTHQINHIKIMVYDKEIKSKLDGIIGVFPMIGTVNSKLTKGDTIALNLAIDPKKLAKLNQSEIDNYVQQFIITPLYFESHQSESSKKKSDTIHTYLENLKHTKQSFTLVKQ